MIRVGQFEYLACLDVFEMDRAEYGINTCDISQWC